MKYTNSQYIKKAKAISSEYKLDKYINTLLNYWEENPTTLGHGFEHVTKAAVECYEMAEMNNYKHPEELFIAGLFHDIYRPAEGKHASEDHHKESAEIIDEVFTKNNLSITIMAKMLQYFEDEDSWRTGDSDIKRDFDKYLFFGERATHDIFMGISYAWSSNQYAKANGKMLPYTNHTHIIYTFVRYQVNIWKKFMQYRNEIANIEKGIDAYLNLYKTATNNYFLDKQGLDFEEYMSNQVTKVRKNEIRFLKSFNRSERSIEKIMRRMI